MSDARVMASEDAAESSLANDSSKYNELSSYWANVSKSLTGIEQEELNEFLDRYDKELEGYGWLVAVEALGRILSQIMERDHQMIAMAAFLHAWGFSQITVESMEKNGHKLGVTKQAVSKEVTYWRDLFKSRALGTAKSEEARQTYREVQCERYEKLAQQQPEDSNGADFSNFFN
jgi:hypothetical protein